LSSDGTRLVALNSNTDTLRLINAATGQQIGATLSGAALGLDFAIGEDL